MAAAKGRVARSEYPSRGDLGLDPHITVAAVERCPLDHSTTRGMYGRVSVFVARALRARV